MSLVAFALALGSFLVLVGSQNPTTDAQMMVWLPIFIATTLVCRTLEKIAKDWYR